MAADCATPSAVAAHRGKQVGFAIPGPSGEPVPEDSQAQEGVRPDLVLTVVRSRVRVEEVVGMQEQAIGAWGNEARTAGEHLGGDRGRTVGPGSRQSQG